MIKSNLNHKHQIFLPLLIKKAVILMYLSPLAISSCSSNKKETSPKAVLQRTSQTDPEGPTRKETQEQETKPWETYSTPISNMLVRQFSHLRPFEGHLLLSSGNIHVVIAGIPPDDKQEWIDGIIASFRYDHQTSSWKKNPLLQQIQFRVGSESDHYVPIGLTTDRNQQRSTLKFILQSSKRRGMRISMSFIAQRNQDRFFVQFRHQERSKKDAITLKARVFSKKSSSFLISPHEDHAYGVTAYRNDHVFSFISSSFVNINRPNYRELTLVSDSEERTAELRFGFDQHLDIAYRIGQMKECQKDDAACMASVPFTVTLSSAERDRFLPEISHPIMLKDGENKPIAFLGLEQGQDIRLSLFPYQPIKVIELQSHPSTRAIVKSGPQEAATLQLPKFSRGTLEAQWNPDNNVPARISILRLDDHFAFNRAPQKKSNFMLLLNENNTIFNQSPAKINLPTGAYLIRVINERIGLYCSKKVEISPSAISTIFCNRLANEPAPKRGLVRVSSLSQANLHAPLLRLLHKHQWLTDSKVHASPDNIQTISIWDHSESLYVSIYPISSAIHSKWVSWFRPNSARPLKKLLAFREKHTKQSKVEFGCSPESSGILQFEQEIRRLDPDIVQVMGCGSETLQTFLFKTLDNIMISRKKRILLTTSDIVRTAQNSNTIHLPMIHKNQPNEPWEISLEKGHYFLSRGALLSWQKGLKNNRSLKITVKALPKIIPTKIVLKNAGQTQLSQPLEMTDGIDQKEITLPSRIKGWYRIEVIGHEDQTTNQRLLATSNYLYIQ